MQTMPILEVPIFNLVHHGLSAEDKVDANKRLLRAYAEAIPHVREGADELASDSEPMVFLVVYGADKQSREWFPVCDHNWPADDYMGLLRVPRRVVIHALNGHRKVCSHLAMQAGHCVVVALFGFVAVGPLPPKDLDLTDGGKFRVVMMPAPPPGAPS
jgi:hypothetical protein